MWDLPCVCVVISLTRTALPARPRGWRPRYWVSEQASFSVSISSHPPCKNTHRMCLAYLTGRAVSGNARGRQHGVRHLPRHGIPARLHTAAAAPRHQVHQPPGRQVHCSPPPNTQQPSAFPYGLYHPPPTTQHQSTVCNVLCGADCRAVSSQQPPSVATQSNCATSGSAG